MSSIRIGSIWLNQNKEGKKYPSIKLGTTGKNAQYNYTVELVVKDQNNNVVAKQVNGFINMFEPNEKAPENLKYDLTIKV